MGATGFPDWQRVGPWDGPALYSFTGTLTGVRSSPIFSTSRWARLAGYVQPTTFFIYVRVRWFADQAGAVQVGQRVFVVDPNIGSNLNLQVPNLGPWCQVTLTPLGGNAVVSLSLFGTNRAGPLEVIPNTDWLQLIEGQNVLAGGSITTPFSTYFAGKAHVWFAPAAGTPWTLQLGGLDTTGAYQVFWQARAIAGGADQHFDVEIPGTACESLIINGSGAAAQAFLSITPGVTGD